MYNDFKFKKKFGQNFLVDSNIVSKIVNTIDIRNDNLVVEIGCGDGKLTKKLCEYFDYVLGYEIDLDVKERLFASLSEFDNFNIIFNDFLECDLNKDISNYEFDNLYVVGNLPYYITTPIIEKLVLSGLDFNSMIFMVQKEVGDRIGARVGTREYGSLTVFLSYFYDIKKEFVVSRNSFVPKPNVDSMIISFTKKSEIYDLKDRELFFKLVRDSFKFKRKTLRNNLSDGYDLEKVNSVLNKYGYDLSVRAEQLSVLIFCDIANCLVS